MCPLSLAGMEEMKVLLHLAEVSFPVPLLYSMRLTVSIRIYGTSELYTMNDLRNLIFGVK